MSAQPFVENERPHTTPVAAAAPQPPGLVPAQPLTGPENLPALTPEDLRRRWDLVLQHRADLLRIARRRLQCHQDAEDVVATAMMRTVESRSLEEARVGSFLCSTVLRLVADVHRERARQLAIGHRQAARELASEPADESACDRAEARWLAAALADCPERERAVLQARMLGLVGRDVATHLNLSVKATENAYTRLRERAQKLVAATLGVLGFGSITGRRGLQVGAVGVPAVLAALAIGFAPLPSEAGLDEPAGSDARTGAPAAVTVVEDTEAEPEAPVIKVEAPAAVTKRPKTPAAASAEPTRRVLFRPAEAAPGLLSGGSVSMEDQPQYEDESFFESTVRCVNGVNIEDPTADPCA